MARVTWARRVQVEVEVVEVEVEVVEVEVEVVEARGARVVLGIAD